MRTALGSFLFGSLALLACGLPAVPAASPTAPIATGSAASSSSAPPTGGSSATAVVPTIAAAPPSYTFADPDRRRKLLAAIPAVETAIHEEIARQKLPGLAIGIVIDGELAYTKGFGVTDIEAKKTPDADTIFRIGSITKSFIAEVTLALRDSGVISLEDPLTKYMPEAAGLVYPTRDAPAITIRHLLNHTSGLPRDHDALPPGASEDAFLKALSGFALDASPGERFAYSNAGFALLGIALGRAAHQPYRELVASYILEPLGMTSTAWEPDKLKERLATPYVLDPKGQPRRIANPPPLGAGEAAGGLYSSVRDLSRYLSAQLGAYPARNDAESPFLRRSSLREAHAASADNELHIAMSSAPRKGESLVRAATEGYGFGWRAEQTCEFDDSVWHGGGLPGFRADIRFLRDRGVGVIALLNSEGEPTEISRRILTELRRTGALIKRTTPPAPQLETAMGKLLAIYNTWDEAAYRAARKQGGPFDVTEKAELAEYKTLHGACKGFTTVVARGSQAATFKLDCERGPFEMQISIAKDGLVTGFLGVSRDQPLSKELRPVAEAVALLIRKWDPAVYAKYLAKAKKPLDAAMREFEDIRAAHEICKIKSATLEADERTIELACARGGDLLLKLDIDPKEPSRVTNYAIQNPDSGPCPLR